MQHNLAFNHPFPLAMARAEGAHLTDVDGNRYIDFLQAGGPTLLGSNHPAVRDAVEQDLDESGPVTGLLHESEIRLAELVSRLMPSIEMLRLLGSGTEAVMAAVRLARAFTRRKWIIKVGGAYHGWSDQLVYGMRLPRHRPHGGGRHPARLDRLDAGGSARTTSTPCAASCSLNRLLGRHGGGAGRAAGPGERHAAGRRATTTPRRGRCATSSARCLIFDEVVTGFRVGMGGAQGYFGVKPDLTVLGKCLAGGYPMAGAVGGRREIMALFAAGIGGSGRRAFVGGTLSANPLSCAAGCAALLEAERTDAAVKAGQAGDRLRKGLDEIIERRKLPYVAYNLGSIVHLQTSGVLLLDTSNLFKLIRARNEAKTRKQMMEEMGAAYSAHGLITLAGSRIYTSLADDDAVIDDALNRFDDVFALV